MLAGDLTRRTLLRRGAALTLAAGGASALSLERLLSTAPAAADQMRKCISLGGPGSLREDNHPDDYRAWGNREFILATDTTWVKLWVSWDELQRELGRPPGSRAESWQHLNGAPGGQSWLRRLDAQVKAAKDDGRGVIVTLYQAYPPWASGAAAGEPGTAKPAEQKVPLDLSPDGPWGWFIAHLIARYCAGAPPNPVGPHEPAPGEPVAGHDPRVGNPAGGHIDALEIVNEPNHLLWPQEGIEAAVAAMIRSAELLSRAWGPTALVAPATSDFPDHDTSVQGVRAGTEWHGFTQRLLGELAGFVPGVPVRWSHHNYRDVRLAPVPTRAERVAALLRAAGWSQEPRPLWLTEGGLDLGRSWADGQARAEQARKIERSFRRMADTGDAFMWTQHTINDKLGNTWKGALRDDYAWTGRLGARRPAWHTWRRVPGAPAP